VLPFGSVAVAVIRLPPKLPVTVVLIVALQELFVVTLAAPMKVCPSPNPDGSHRSFAKNSTRNVVLAVLSSEP